MSEGELAESLI